MHLKDICIKMSLCSSLVDDRDFPSSIEPLEEFVQAGQVEAVVDGASYKATGTEVQTVTSSGCPAGSMVVNGQCGK